jgi:hypothetical protein
MSGEGLTPSNGGDTTASFRTQWEETRHNILKQLISLRLAVVLLAFVVIGVLAYTLMVGAVPANPRCLDDSVVGGAVIVSPILGLTAIVTILVIGVFRGFRDRDMERGPVDAASRAGAAAVSG